MHYALFICIRQNDFQKFQAYNTKGRSKDKKSQDRSYLTVTLVRIANNYSSFVGVFSTAL